jgi:hypothetical protein
MIRKILSWFGFKKYIKIVNVDPINFEMSQLMNKKNNKIETKLNKKFQQKK